MPGLFRQLEVLYRPCRHNTLRATCLWPAYWDLHGVVLLTVCLQPRAVRLLFLFAASGCGTLGCRSVSGLSTVVWSSSGVDELLAFLSLCHCYSPQDCGHIPLRSCLSLRVLVVLTRLRTLSLVFTCSHPDGLRVSPWQHFTVCFFYSLPAPRVLCAGVLVLCFFGPCI